jgi:hypothetical protein
MEDRLSSACLGWLDAPGVASKTGRRGGGSPRCALSACDMSRVEVLRGLPLPAAPPLADLLRHCPAFGDDGLGLGGGDRGGVGVADDLRQAAVQHHPGALGQVGSDHAQRPEVVLAPLDHLHVVAAGQLGVEAAGVVGGADQGGAQQPVAGLGDGWPLRSVWPVSDALGARPVKEPTLARWAKRLAGPMVATSAGPPTSARPGRLRASPPGSTRRYQDSRSAAWRTSSAWTTRSSRTWV